MSPSPCPFFHVPSFQDRGVSPNSYTLSTLITAYGRAGQWENALALFHRARGELGVEANEFVFNSTMNAMRLEKQVDSVLELFDVMARESEMGGQGGGGDGDGRREEKGGEAFEVNEVDEVARVAGGVAPDAFSYQTAISACASAGRVEEAWALFRRMEEAEVESDVFVFNALLDACAKGGEPAKDAGGSHAGTSMAPTSCCGTARGAVGAAAWCGILLPV